MRTIDGHFTIINEPGTARAMAAEFLEMFESVRSPEQIIITEKLIELAAQRSQGVLSHSLLQSIRRVQSQIDAIGLPGETVTFPRVDKAQLKVLELTNRAEKSSTSKNWRKLDSARKRLAKELDRADFASYTAYVDYITSQDVGGVQRRELLIELEELKEQKKNADNNDKSLASLNPSQIITVLADVLSRCPHTPVGPLPIVIDDALRNVDVATKLRAMEVLKAHSSHYATWYVTDDPIVLSWAGFTKEIASSPDTDQHRVYDVESDIA